MIDKRHEEIKKRGTKKSDVAYLKEVKRPSTRSTTNKATPAQDSSADEVMLDLTSDKEKEENEAKQEIENKKEENDETKNKENDETPMNNNEAQANHESAFRTVYAKKPDFIPGDLFPFQITGLNFLHSAWESRTNVILGDEMGLGKTYVTFNLNSV